MTGPSVPHTAQQSHLLSPAEVARLGGLEVTTPGIVDGFLAGLHRSPRRGFSVEFAEHRSYQFGDEPRYVDWKLLARTDRLYVKQFEEETNLQSMLVVDGSASMGWQGAPERISKLDYAARLAAAIALVLLRQRDGVGLLTFDEVVRDLVPVRARSGQWRILATRLAQVEAGRGTASEPALRQVVGALRRRGLVVLLSDLLLDRDLTLKALRFLRHRGHHVVVLHIADPAELELERGDETRFRDPESNRSVTLAPSDWADAYRETVAEVLQSWRLACRASGIHYATITTDLPFGEALGRALAHK